MGVGAEAGAGVFKGLLSSQAAGVDEVTDDMDEGGEGPGQR